MSPTEMVREFHRAMGQAAPDTPTLDVGEETRAMRIALIDEELEEFEVALLRNDLVGVADALGDLMYVVVGAAVTFGIPLDDVFQEIHRSNMTKVGPDGQVLYRGDGKVLKPPTFQPPQLVPILEKAMA